jgi:hypothetical protein
LGIFDFLPGRQVSAEIQRSRDSHADMETLCDESGVCLDGDEEVF